MSSKNPHPFDLGLVIDLHQLLSYVSPNTSGLLSKVHRESKRNDANFKRAFVLERTASTIRNTYCLLQDPDLPDANDNFYSEERFSSSSSRKYPSPASQSKPHHLGFENKHINVTCIPPHNARIVPISSGPSFCPNDRKAVFLQQIVNDFPLEAPFLLHVKGKYDLIASGTAFAPTAHVFVDHSNILIGYTNTTRALYGSQTNTKMQLLSFHSLSLILERGRGIAKRVLVGSSRLSPSIRQAEGLKYETCILERVTKEIEDSYTSSSDFPNKKVVRRKQEQMVDELLQMKMLESLLDYPPSILVLATGDAAIAEYSHGFSAVVHRAINLGWFVELVAFNASISNIWRKDHGWGNKFRIITLDAYVLGLSA